MPIFHTVDLSKYDQTPEQAEVISELLISEYSNLNHAFPTAINVVSSGIGQVVGTKMIDAGLPVSLISQAEWNQAAYYLDTSITPDTKGI
jgi:hypothetical protein